MKAKSYKRQFALVRAVLNTDWDPIGVAHEVDDEYDAYVPSVVSRLVQGANASEIVEYLRTVEIESMGLGRRSDEDLLEVANKLLTLQESDAWHA